ncbi:MAG: porin family protein [Balneolaceae bacterium]|nr:porin family protein [Balneolaceae bacterium]
MKKRITILCLALLTLFSADLAFAQDNSAGDLKIGGGLMYGTDIEQLGFEADGVYTINEQFRAQADLGFYLPNKTDFGNGSSMTITWWEFNANAHYMLMKDAEQGLSLYALGGLNFLSVNVESEGVGGLNISGSDSEMGINVGAGGEFDLDFASLYAEIKYSLGSADQLNIGAGLRFPVGN